MLNVWPSARNRNGVAAWKPLIKNISSEITRTLASCPSSNLSEDDLLLVTLDYSSYAFYPTVEGDGDIRRLSYSCWTEVPKICREATYRSKSLAFSFRERAFILITLFSEAHESTSSQQPLIAWATTTWWRVSMIMIPWTTAGLQRIIDFASRNARLI